jgi:hypothetical protein
MVKHPRKASLLAATILLSFCHRGVLAIAQMGVHLVLNHMMPMQRSMSPM